MENIKIALLGSIPKGDEVKKQFYDWKQDYIKVLEKHLPNAEILSGDAVSDHIGSEMVVGHDLGLVKKADVIVVDARTRAGAGTAQEMVMAKYFKKPVISVIPKNSHHRKSNLKFEGKLVKEWIHPFLFVSSDVVISDIEELPEKIKRMMKNPEQVKDISVFKNAIAKFEKSKPI